MRVWFNEKGQKKDDVFKQNTSNQTHRKGNKEDLVSLHKLYGFLLLLNVSHNNVCMCTCVFMYMHVYRYVVYICMCTT